MEARLNGFRFNGAETYGLNVLGSYLDEISGEKFVHDRQERRLITAKKGAFRVGVLLSLREQKNIPQIDDALEVYIHQMEAGRMMFEFNFFAFHEQTGAGVYQHYYGSYSMLRFGTLMARLYDDVLRTNGEPTVNVLFSRESMRLSRERLALEIVCSRRRFEEIVRRLKYARSFEYDIVTTEDMSRSTRPLHRHAKLERKILRMKDETSGRVILNGIRDLIPRRVRGKLFRVTGVDEYGDLQRIDYDSDIPDQFHADDVDELANTRVLSLKSIDRSPYVDIMLDVIRDNEALLGPED